MSQSSQIIHVAVSRPIYYALSYLCEDRAVKLGCRVLIPLGNTEITGVVTGIQESKESEIKLKSIIRLIDQEPLFDIGLLKLFNWANHYYHTPIGDVIFTALPVALRKTKQVPQKKGWQLSKTSQSLDIATLDKAKKQKIVIQAMCDNSISKTIFLDEDCKKLCGSGYRAILKALEKKQWVEPTILTLFQAIKNTKATDFQQTITLSDEQQICLNQFQEWTNEAPLKPILLYGITGSGKTEVYLRMISQTIKAGKQALILVPEIGLTTQLIDRFQSYFSKQTITTLNSSVAKGERLENWIATKSGDADIIIGTRSAVFAAFKSLGIIIIDEEHDGSFKQQDGFRYHARDIAVKRAYDLQIPIVLGTATPSLETLHNSDQNKYHYSTLKRRPGTRTPPEVLVQDTKGLYLDAGLSQPLLAEIKQSVEQGNQVMLFLNRRGFAPTLFCSNCGWHSQCRDCDTNMTYHAKIQKMVCHHCGYEEKTPYRCPSCNSESLDTMGHGTERVEIALQGHFEKIPIIRIDRDSISRKGEMDRKLQIIRDGKPAILLGTQMLAKGHDFPKVTLVGILDIDQSLFSTDFRAPERLAQLIIQVAGRSGRGEQKGKVMLQTCQPDHPLLVTLLSQGYLAFANSLLEQRKRWSFPPYSYQALIRAEGLEKSQAMQFLEKVSEKLENSGDVMVMGPIPSAMERRAKWYRAQLLLNSINRKALHQLIASQLIAITKIRKGGKVRWSIDIDPIDLL